MTQGHLMPGVSELQASAPAEKAPGAKDFTGTNNQEADVDEADYIKNDDKV